MLITRIPSISSSTVTPASFNLATTGFKCSGNAFSTNTSPPAIAAAIKYVPASIRSGITVWIAPCRDSTPSIRITFVPAPRIFAPIAFKNVAKSTISGSSAAFSITVLPLAIEAAMITFSVAPTLGKSK